MPVTMTVGLVHLITLLAPLTQQCSFTLVQKQPLKIQR